MLENTQDSNNRERKLPLRPILVGLAWIGLLAGGQLWLYQAGMNPQEALRELEALCEGTWLAPLFFLGAAVIAPLLMLPAALLGVAAGAIFGPIWGIIWTLIGCNLAASIAYFMGRSLCPPEAGERVLQGRLARYYNWLQRNSLIAIIMMRLAFLPYDAVSYGIGALRIGWPRFMLANALGVLPGVVTLVWFGSLL
jgi:uncharacterized membrane protein YdjX (TVP38/TMEM64 family)